MGTLLGRGVLSSGLLSVHTHCFPWPLPWLLALSSESPPFFFPCTLKPYPGRHSLMLILFNRQTGASPKAGPVAQGFFARAYPQMAPGPGSRVPEWGSGRLEPPVLTGAGLEAWLITCGHTWYARCMRELQGCPFACMSVACYFRQLFWFRGSEKPSVLPHGIRDQSGAAAGVLPPTPRAAGHKVLGSGPEKVEA